MDSILIEPSKTILLVDDELLVLRSCRRMFSRLGYEVMDAQSGEEAVVLYHDHWQQINLVLLDLIMPSMSGKTTFTKLREMNPEVKVLLSSGYLGDELVDSLIAQGAVGFVKKPFGIQELSDKVHSIEA